MSMFKELENNIKEQIELATSDVTSAISSQEAQLSTVKEQLKQGEEELNKVQKQVSDIETNVTESFTELEADLKDEFGKVKASIKDLEEKGNNDGFLTLKSEVKAADSAASRAHDLARQVNSDVKSLGQTVDTVSRVSQDAQATAKTAKVEAARAHNRVDFFADSVADLREKTEETQKDVKLVSEMCNNAVSKVQSQVNLNTNQTSVLSASLAELKAKVKELQTSCREEESASPAQEARLDAMARKFAQINAAINNLVNRVEDIEDDPVFSLEDVVETIEQLQEFKDEINHIDFESTFDDLQKDVEKLSDRVNELESFDVDEVWTTEDFDVDDLVKHNDLEELAEATKEGFENAENAIEEVEEKVDENSGRLDVLETELKDAIKESKKAAEKVVETFSDEGYVKSTYVDSLSRRLHDRVDASNSKQRQLFNEVDDLEDRTSDLEDAIRELQQELQESKNDSVEVPTKKGVKVIQKDNLDSSYFYPVVKKRAIRGTSNGNGWARLGVASLLISLIGFAGYLTATPAGMIAAVCGLMFIAAVIPGGFKRPTEMYVKHWKVVLKRIKGRKATIYVKDHEVEALMAQCNIDPERAQVIRRDILSR